MDPALGGKQCVRCQEADAPFALLTFRSVFSAALKAPLVFSAPPERWLFSLL